MNVNSVLFGFKTVLDQTKHPRLEQRSVIRFSLAEKCKPGEIYRKI